MSSVPWCNKLNKPVEKVERSECQQTCSECPNFTAISKKEADNKWRK